MTFPESTPVVTVLLSHRMYCSKASLLEVFSLVRGGARRLRFGKSYSYSGTQKDIQNKNLLLYSTLGRNEISEGVSEVIDNETKKRLFNTVLWEKDPQVSFTWRKALEKKEFNLKRRQEILQGIPQPLPHTLKLLDDYDTAGKASNVQAVEIVEDCPPTYPFAQNDRTKLNEGVSSSRRVQQRHDQRRKLAKTMQEKEDRMKKWMSDYAAYDENSEENLSLLHGVNFGSANPNEPVSKVPCGGCGALLHCQDPSIPGYLPSELFANRKEGVLRSMICQRCHFLKEFNVALNVSVAPEDYPKIISTIQDKRAIAVLMVDLLDFPCSIWPNMMDIIGSKRPVIIVGNKIDLIPGDQKGYLKHVKNTLQLYVEKLGIGKSNIKHVALISAQTGFGVEDLITHLHELWEYKSDVFLLGCTNVGKSTLFNKLLQSDFCKTQASDLVQRATTSIWPGTTLNLLKFPVLRPEGWRLAHRRKRLASQAHIRQKEKELQKDQLGRRRMYRMPALLQYVGKTFRKLDYEEGADMFQIKRAADQTGLNEKDRDFAEGRWCYDTPGVMHPDQVLNLLTTEELMKVIPKTPLVPRFFMLKPGRSLFLAGLGRIDLLDSTRSQSTRVAVFSSCHLPVTIVQTHEADDLYCKLLGTELTAVPCGGPQRLADWPGLKQKDEIITVHGTGWKECCADVVLSCAGWVSVSGGVDMEMSFRVWTPLGRGIHLRQPALLPQSINFRGERISHTPTYKTGRSDGKAAP